MEHNIENLNILTEESIITPNELKEKLPLSSNAIDTISKGQKVIKNILNGKDSRKFIVVGPCSIHDRDSALEYASRLIELQRKVEDQLILIMRVYFEKPRTTLGWQGLVNDPHLDDSCNINEGLHIAREILIDIAELGLPTAGEALDLITPQYIQDLFSWTAIGARTTESQNHRRMASGLSTAVGFKNGTDGNFAVAINAMHAAAGAHNFVSVNPEGHAAIIRTRGNPLTHIVLRGGLNKTNYDAESISLCEKELEVAGLSKNIMVDCSHANCGKVAEKQIDVIEDVTKQIIEGNKSICSLMIESHLHAGRQNIPRDLKELKYGVSITDPCLGWKDTEKALLTMHNILTLS